MKMGGDVAGQKGKQLARLESIEEGVQYIYIVNNENGESVHKKSADGTLENTPQSQSVGRKKAMHSILLQEQKKWVQAPLQVWCPWTKIGAGCMGVARIS